MNKNNNIRIIAINNALILRILKERSFIPYMLLAVIIIEFIPLDMINNPNKSRTIIPTFIFDSSNTDFIMVAIIEFEFKLKYMIISSKDMENNDVI